MRSKYRGRGVHSNTSGRFERLCTAPLSDQQDFLENEGPLRTKVVLEAARTIITRNKSPDLSFDRSINPYQGCEHGCSYCYARPTHAYWGLSPGADFESQIFAKTNAAELLRLELSKPSYIPKAIVLGANTDPYQPIERQYRITREILRVLLEFNHPIGLITKSASILRDLDILKDLASRQLVKVAVSVTSLNSALARSMEPRASTPKKRLEALKTLSSEGIPTTVMVAPIIPAINDKEIENILAAASLAGVSQAGYVLLRLPREVLQVFREWLDREMPNKAQHVMSLIRSTRDGKDYEAAWGKRMKGSGPYSQMIKQLFEASCRRHGLNRGSLELETKLFSRQVMEGQQMSLI
ncbi:DNA repair photolyase [Rhodoligotrophos appendicifer]|uniref:PA0069 family radical SAM protein n=1 Tax=Rhodoligotrophos appendicifer TaxID=987056 RepID=UPI001FEA955E|nr:PA0069 family radical SAM protein [Rhodoligotrophos appendicifer]